MDEKMINWLIQGIIGGLAALAVYFAKQTHQRIENDIKDRKEEIRALKAEVKEETAELRREIDDMRNAMPFTYVLREDFIRLMASFEHKLDMVLYKRKNEM